MSRLWSDLGTIKSPISIFRLCFFSEWSRCLPLLWLSSPSVGFLITYSSSSPISSLRRENNCISYFLFVFSFQILSWLPHYLVFLMFYHKLQKVMVAWFTRDTFLLCYWLAMVRALYIITGWGWWSSCMLLVVPSCVSGLQQFPEAIWRTHYQIIWFFEDQSDKDKLIIKLNLGKESIQKSQKWTENYPL